MTYFAPVFSEKEVIAQQSDSNAKIAGHTPHVLLVEDNRITLDILKFFIQEIKFRYTAAINGEIALQLAKTQPFDFIITDIGLPGISGLDFTEKFRAWELEQLRCPTPIIGLTALNLNSIREESSRLGMNDLLCKPITLSMLRTIVAKLSLPVFVE